MKKVSLLFGALALVLGLSQCKKAEMPVVGGNLVKQDVTLNATFGDGSKIDQNGAALKWTVGDVLTVKQSGSVVGEVTCVNESGIFNGTMEVNPVEKIVFNYGTEEFVDQNGKLNDAIWLSSPEVDYVENGNYGEVSMTMTHAVLKLDLSKVNMPVDGDNGTVVVFDGTNSYTVTFPVESKDEVYVALRATPNPIEYEFNCYGMSKEWTLAANTFYTQNGGSKDATGESIVIDPEWVDLNDATTTENPLPKVALKNVGATNATEGDLAATTWYGDYYAYGEIKSYCKKMDWISAFAGTPVMDNETTFGAGGKNKGGYNNNTYCNSNSPEFSEWSNIPHELGILKAGNDVAKSSLGGSWRTPTNQDWQRVLNNAYFCWVNNYGGVNNLNGIIAYKAKSEEDRGKVGGSSGNYNESDVHFFIPAVGLIPGDNNNNSAGLSGRYMSASLSSSYSNMNGMVYIKNESSVASVELREALRCSSFAVRPVK